MPEASRNRECVVLFKGDAYPVEIDDSLAATGWPGGQGVMWASNPKDGFFVKQSDGYYAGFLLDGSNESGDLYTGMTRNQPIYKIGTLCGGGWLIMTSTFERYTWDSRHGLGPPNVPIVYRESDRLVFSARGWLTSEDEWTKSGDPRAPNTYYIAFVVQAPTAANGYFITVQTSI